MAEALSWLRSKEVWSRGRFGAFKYELGDIESCFIQGVEAVDNILDGAPEKCLFQPSDVMTCSMTSFPSYDIPPTANDSVSSSTISISSDLATDAELSSVTTDQNSELSIDVEPKGQETAWTTISWLLGLLNNLVQYVRNVDTVRCEISILNPLFFIDEEICPSAFSALSQTFSIYCFVSCAESQVYTYICDTFLSLFIKRWISIK